MIRFLPAAASVLGLFALLSCGAAPKQAEAPAPTAPAVIFPDGWTVQVEVATTQEQHARGLMYVKSLAPDHGMIFLFDTDEVRPFWMKNCFIALDMVWLDEHFRVVDMSRDVQPCAADPCPNVFPDRPIRHVLEVSAGLCAAHHLAVGDHLLTPGITAPPQGGAAP